jgi:hypothetical protein
MAKRFKAIMTRRPSVERMIKRLKCDLGDDRLSKRGNDSFQAYLDKTMISYHLLIRHLHLYSRPYGQDAQLMGQCAQNSTIGQ